MVLYYIFTENPPKFKLKDKMSGNPLKLPESSSSISKFCISLIKSCLSFDPEDRPSFDDILNEIRKHSYALASGVDKEELSGRDEELNEI